jgi:hypothetical protein
VQNCTDKFLKHSERVGARFAEHNAGALPVGCMKLLPNSHARGTFNTFFLSTEQMSSAQGGAGSDYLK